MRKLGWNAISNILLDMSGIGLGIFLVGLGWWALSENFSPQWIWWLTILFGISAFLIHLFRYFGLKPIRKFFGF